MQRTLTHCTCHTYSGEHERTPHHTAIKIQYLLLHNCSTSILPSRLVKRTGVRTVHDFTRERERGR
uniref:Uncharacterized protein n=1 Tax=Aegilops tauschii subsp. strangulata TaxID=200361 RepID=A0A453SWH4_AEGTS